MYRFQDTVAAWKINVLDDVWCVSVAAEKAILIMKPEGEQACKRNSF